MCIGMCCKKTKSDASSNEHGVALTSIEERLKDPDHTLMFGFLYDGFGKDKEWWELVVVLRKIFMIVILVMVQDPFLQTMFALGVVLFASYMQAVYSPYKEPLVNRAELLSLFTTLMTQLISIIYFWIDNEKINKIAAVGAARAHAIENLVTILLIVINIDATVAFGVLWWAANKDEVISI